MLRVATVGAGPSAFFAAEEILARADGAAEVDVFDRLPTPFGLVRAGVAPDHPRIKSVTRVYERTAARPGFRFFGNVEVGRDLAVEELARRCHAVVHAFGMPLDRRLGIPGEDLAGSHPATAFVGWYNAHPDHSGHDFDLSCERAVVVGNGNVAADVARMLALPVEELRRTDVADHALAALERSRVREVVVLGRRGPAQAAFTTPELRELAELPGVDLVVGAADVALDPASAAYLASDAADPTHRRNVELLATVAQRRPSGAERRVRLLFGRTPCAIAGDGRVERLVVGHNELVADAGGRVRARDTGAREEMECGLVLRAVGSRGVGLPGVPFDPASGAIPNDRGRVLARPGGEPIPGHYAVGWVKRGPAGVIGTNKRDAQETVASLFADLEAGRLPAPDPNAPPVERLLDERGADWVSYSGWGAIDRAEVAAGEPQGRPRVKLATVDELLAAAGGDHDR